MWRLLAGAGLFLSRRLFGDPTLALGFERGEKVPADVVAYFADPAARLYQLEQWLPVFERLDERHRVLLVLRDAGTYHELEGVTNLRRVLVPQFAQLTELYAENDYRVGLYVNNGSRNFQSLSHQTMLHVHISHGESDKISMVSNQAKAYDRVFVAGEAAICRHRAALIGFDERKLVPIGRPQLDFVEERKAQADGRKTILYAPTWEGENASNNYTSVDVFGERISKAVLSLPNVRFVYKPHPRVALSRVREMLSAHESICRLVADAAKREPSAGHEVALDGDILALLPAADAMITDVSSVGLDFLYLETDKPLFVTDRRNDRDRLLAEAPVSGGADIVDREAIPSLAATLSARLERDDHREARERLRGFYFGDVAVGESTRLFVDAVGRLVSERDTLLARRTAAADALTDKGARAAVMERAAAGERV
ncbi:MAG: CDP-glycerol glycerophosphotransferase family protein [Actinomycetota bacterium]|nr:CDP-glycerol glycerophosphotransferase family protein [Actinomycetota bacterium]